ncbi:MULTISPECIES: hypothetical protein [Neisseria]|uniref:hypothetical protein n=1 Tax=Neisseria TaxID=482 RepID=UPI0012FD5C8F|nr:MULTISPECIES: hypothetical protein [Neisseria]
MLLQAKKKGKAAAVACCFRWVQYRDVSDGLQAALLSDYASWRRFNVCNCGGLGNNVEGVIIFQNVVIWFSRLKNKLIFKPVRPSEKSSMVAKVKN